MSNWQLKGWNCQTHFGSEILQNLGLYPWKGELEDPLICWHQGNPVLALGDKGAWNPKYSAWTARSMHPALCRAGSQRCTAWPAQCYNHTNKPCPMQLYSAHPRASFSSPPHSISLLQKAETSMPILTFLESKMGSPILHWSIISTCCWVLPSHSAHF